MVLEMATRAGRRGLAEVEVEVEFDWGFAAGDAASRVSSVRVNMGYEI